MTNVATTEQMLNTPQQQRTASKNNNRYAAVPPELKSLRQWARWTTVPRPKTPAYLNGKPMEWGNRDNWLTFDQVARFDKIGYFNSLESGFIGIDFDGCRNKETGEIHPLVLGWIKDTYAEVSPNEEGIKAYFKGTIPNGKTITNKNVPWGDPKDHVGIEIYAQKRFFTVTGSIVPGCPSVISEAPEVLNDILVHFTEAPKVRGKVSPEPTNGNWDVDRWVYQNLDVVEKLADGYVIVCPWCAEHTTPGDTARIWTSPKYTFNCFHAHCAGREWSDVRLKYEPTAYDKRDQWANYSPGQTSSNGNGHVSLGSQQTTDKQQSYNLTDLGNAERFAAKYGDRVRWCETWNTWLIFNDKCWEADRTGRVDHLAKVTVRAIHHEAANPALKKEDAQKLSKHAFASESNRAVRAMLDRAKSELPAIPAEFNKHLYLLNCNNGTLDLRTGELRPHSPYDMLTRCLKTDYNPNATCPKWTSFIDSIFASDQALTQFMQEALGMSLCGDTSEQCLFICHGSGSNGKTTMLETVRIIMEDYGLAANIETFSMRKNQGIGNDVAELYGARLVTASENALGSRLNEAFIKKATGKEPLRARRLHENEFQFMPEFTIWFAVNHKPVVKDTSKGMWRRVHFIPFSVTIEGDKLDKHLGEKLLDESEGILAWLVQGHINWHERGRLEAPETVLEATKAYRSEMDTIANFIDERCDKSGDVGATTLYQAYKVWCEENGERYEKQKVFGTQLTEHGYERERTREGYVYRGLCPLAVYDVNDVNDKSKSSTQGENTSQKTQKNGSHGSHHTHSEEKPKPPNRACFKCGMQNWQWDEMLETYTCGGCNHG